ncbi:hypothetical protein GJ631_17985 [Natronomonas sp. CBA1123]|uniref:hypothetical protein n=1 Tax=Natronomonas sp. CBA1123 TaxID=2668070 RepID=UPI0012EA5D75|nr:hypothetical protein [Natronomonas sp. CBA1123]MUV88390.1 hypothetical protein [Natronomonas sp. CBA1123]
MKFRATLLSALLVVSLVGAAAAPAAATQSGEAYSGTHVEFQTQNSAVTGYAVNDAVIVENVSVQSSEEARSQAGIGADAGLSTATEFSGAGLQLASQTSLSATVSVESGAEMQAHDNSRGIFQVRANDGAQMVHANLSSDSEAESESDERVVVTKEDGSQGTFIVVGDGEVVVNEEGNVTAEVEEGSQLVYRQYDDGERSEDDEQKEQMIQNGTATAEVFVESAAESGQDSADDGEDSAEDGSDEGEEAAASVVEYGQDTTVEVQSRSENTINMTAERSQSEGKVVLATISNEAFSNAEDVEVFVDGEAAAQADSYSEVEQAAQGGDNSAYYVSQSSSAEASTDVAIGVNHFSERDVSMQSDGGSGDDGGMTGGDGAGFGVFAAVAALGAALLATRRL